MKSYPPITQITQIQKQEAGGSKQKAEGNRITFTGYSIYVVLLLSAPAFCFLNLWNLRNLWIKLSRE